MAHGANKAVFGYDDERVGLSKLFGLLSPRVSPGLISKPKIWLVQTCRSGEEARIASSSTSDRTHEKITCEEADGSLEDGMSTNSSCEFFSRPSDDHDFLWGYAVVSGRLANRGSMFSAFRRVAQKCSLETPWIELLHHTNEELCSALTAGKQEPVSSMEIASTCRGKPFSPFSLCRLVSGK